MAIFADQQDQSRQRQRTGEDGPDWHLGRHVPEFDSIVSRVRQMLAANADLARKLEALEQKYVYTLSRFISWSV